VQEPTSGTAIVDELIDGVRIGDNLVLEGGTDTPLDLLVDRFVSANRRLAPLVLVNLRRPWSAAAPRDAVVLDWSPVLTGEASPLEGSLAPGAGVEEAIASLEAVDDRVGTGAAYVFDPLTAAQEAWGSDGTLELFLAACPRLYRRRSLAIWPVEAEAHSPAFLRRLTEITQVVIEMARRDDDLELTVVKADGRSERVTGRTVRVELVDGEPSPRGAFTSTRERLGTAIRDQRLTRGMSQAEVARRVGISPSALSQVERGVRGPSGDTLVRLWEVLGVPFGPPVDAHRGYRVSRRSGRERTQLQEGLTGERVVDDPAVGQVWLIEVAPGAAGQRPPFAVKTPEVVVVLRGVLEIGMAGRSETLHEGDAVIVDDATVTYWASPGTEVTELLWSLR